MIVQLTDNYHDKITADKSYRIPTTDRFPVCQAISGGLKSRKIKERAQNPLDGLNFIISLSMKKYDRQLKTVLSLVKSLPKMPKVYRSECGSSKVIPILRWSPLKAIKSLVKNYFKKSRNRTNLSESRSSDSS